jgi:hypothetical protein
VERDLPGHCYYEDAVALGGMYRFTAQHRDAMIHEKYDRLTAQQQEEGS